MKYDTRLLLLLIFALTMTACTPQYDPFKNTATDFEMFDDGTFRFSTVDFGPDIAGGNSDRIEWLETILKNNGFCASGYQIDKQRQALIVGERYNVVYYGRCLLT